MALAAGATALPAVASARPAVSAPRVLVIGPRATVVATGFKPRARLSLDLSPTINRGGNCCFYPAGRRTADASGRAVFRFVVPAAYFNCDRCGKRPNAPWSNNQRADVTVISLPNGAQRARAVSRIRRAS